MTRRRGAALSARLEAFLRAMPRARITAGLVARCGMAADEAGAFLETYANEARATLGLIGEDVEPGIKMLEVGAGLCLFSLFLAQEGHDITALDHAAGGFEGFDRARRVILDAYPGLELRVLEIPAQDLATCRDRFELIFSNNVLEHIPALASAWRGMALALAPGGRMVHGCPNYLVPYEPHLGIPVIRRLPWLSAWCFPEAVARHRGIWDSLNFVTYHDVRKLARDSDLAIDFRPGLLHDAVDRLGRDPWFRQRHAGLVLAAHATLRRLGLLRALRQVPPALGTPMIFTCRRRRADADA